MSLFGERQVEIPWLLKNLKPGSVLDIGSLGSAYIGELVKQERQVVRVDRKPLKDDLNTIKLQVDIREVYPGAIGTFDNVILLSTLEHVGLEAYGFKADWKENPFAEQLNTFKHCLNFCGNESILLLSVPFGKYENIGWALIYDRDMIKSLKHQVFQKFNTFLIKETYYTLRGDNYIECQR